MSPTLQVSNLPSRPLTLDEFLAYTKWDPVESRSGMQVALAHYQSLVPQAELRRVVHDAGPWALPIGQPTLRLTQWMQAINFGRPVQSVTLHTGQTLKAFFTQGRLDQANGASRGRWFTKVNEQQHRLAIPRNQQHPVLFRVARPVRALMSTVGDAYVDWARNAAVDAMEPEYRRGGGVQYFVWDASPTNVVPIG